MTEPLTEAETTTSFEPTAIPDEPDMIPLISLSASERERRRLERDRILDLLEQEESVQQTRNEETARDYSHEALEKRNGNAQSEIERLKAAREMQKKMGKALLRNMADAREKEEKKQKEILLHDHTIEEQKKTLKEKKSVSFADLPPEGEGEPKARQRKLQLNWGDVAPAKLRSANRSTLMTKTQMNRHPMKMDVVERLPTVQSEPEEAVICVEDSDDESPIPSPDPAQSDEGDVIQSDREDGPLDGEVELASDEDDLDDGLDDEFDLDSARHHREIALAYYEKRSVIGGSPAKIMASHIHNEEKDEWDQPVCITDFCFTVRTVTSSFLLGSAAGCYTIIFAAQIFRIPLQD